MRLYPDTWFSQFSSIQLRIADAQPAAPPDMLELVTEVISRTQFLANLRRTRLELAETNLDLAEINARLAYELRQQRLKRVRRSLNQTTTEPQEVSS